MQSEFLAAYMSQIASGSFQEDAEQQAAAGRLNDLENQLAAASARKRGLFGFRKSASAINGLYLWGGVGRGKSMLMDMFFAHSAVETKMRRHFLEFMQLAHTKMKEARETGVDDAVKPVAEELSDQAKLLCLDECQIDDIADAVIVGRLFELLMERGTVVCTTSNRPPEDLYKDGLNRQLFLPFIELIRSNLVVHEIGSVTDYRQNRLVGEQMFFVPANPAAAEQIDLLWSRMADGRAEEFNLIVKGRTVVLDQYRNGVARAEFWDLCGQPYGPADFLAIAKSVRALIIENIPLLSRSNYNEARRFVMLIDALYEARVRLVASAAAQPEKLYVEGAGSFEFQRTASRLREMQSGDWSAEE